ncbi:hypothetical protein PO909_014547, partial [Leuciscus waleckii]
RWLWPDTWSNTGIRLAYTLAYPDVDTCTASYRHTVPRYIASMEDRTLLSKTTVCTSDADTEPVPGNPLQILLGVLGGFVFFV